MKYNYRNGTYTKKYNINKEAAVHADHIIKFGKHRLKSIRNIAQLDMGYLEWLYKEMTAKNEDSETYYHLKNFLEKLDTKLLRA